VQSGWVKIPISTVANDDIPLFCRSERSEESLHGVAVFTGWGFFVVALLKMAMRQRTEKLIAHPLNIKQTMFLAAGILLLYLVLWPAGLHAGEWYRVKAVIDGDTLLLADGRFVRYIGINTPEIAHKDKPGEPFGKAATRYNAELVGTGRVQLEYDRQKHDHYGRLLAYVYNEKGVMVNRAMIAAGMA